MRYECSAFHFPNMDQKGDQKQPNTDDIYGQLRREVLLDDIVPSTKRDAADYTTTAYFWRKISNVTEHLAIILHCTATVLIFVGMSVDLKYVTLAGGIGNVLFLTLLTYKGYA